MALDRHRERGGGDVRSEHDHVKARRPQQLADHLQRDDVPLARRRREHHPMPGACALDASDRAVQGHHPGRDRGRDVLVGDRDLAPLPQLADAPERGRDDLIIDLGGREVGVHRLANRDLRRPLVAGEQRVRVHATKLADRNGVILTPVVLMSVGHRSAHL